MSRRTINSASLLLASLIAACADAGTTPATGRALSVSFASTPATASASIAPLAESPLRSVTTTSGADVLVISRVQLVVARLELARSGATCTATAAAGDDAVDEHECAELQLAPSVVEMPVDGSVASVISVSVPAGSYSALEAKVRALRADGDHGVASQAFLAAHPELAGVSVVVNGTFNGKAFTWSGAPRAEFETTFSPPLAVDATPVNLTIHADVTTWFRTPSGTLIDPSTATGTGTNAALVSENIRRSFKAFRDDDRNGHDDGDDHGKS